MNQRTDFFLRLGAAFLITILVAPLVACLFPGTQVHRVLTRTGQGALVLLLLFRAGDPRTWRRRAMGVGMRGPHRCLRQLAGALPAIAVFSLIIYGSYLLGGRELLLHGSRLTLAERALRAVTAAIGVAYFEELIVRGYMKDVLGNLLSAFLFAIIHNFKPIAGSAPVDGSYDPLLVLRNFDVITEAWSDPYLAIPGTIGLMIFAFILNDMRDRSGTLHWGMGFHAGLVLCLAMYRQWLSGAASGARWLYGGSRLYDGALGIGALLACWAAVRFAPRPNWLKHKGADKRQ